MGIVAGVCIVAVVGIFACAAVIVGSGIVDGFIFVVVFIASAIVTADIVTAAIVATPIFAVVIVAIVIVEFAIVSLNCCMCLPC